ncbi:MAG: glycosyltransferase family 4 protein [Bacteroidales bacterium]|nr:glycosyltransferase family 4 protein [Bacteroidales bacterium]MCM1146586.1 glycosyltransferase family 4 protein [Bacteroidales bacterium]MCM1205978.1 glycosyltransferase family 4 protein [Bacillota bacterium]MCM1510141.1 glycosyltransferase family 4 protein [Clostridium sp.]
MKIIYDNIIYALQRCGGISVVWSNLITRCLKKGDGNISFLDYEHENISRSDISLPEENIIKKKLHVPSIQRFINPSGRDFRTNEPFIFHSSYYRTLNRPNAINVTTVHDFVYSFYVKNPVSRFLHCRQQYDAIRKSDIVVCISENTKKDLLQLLPDVSPEKVKVIYNGVDNRFRRIPGTAYKDYFLFVGNRGGYKNFTAIIEPVARCGFELRIVGPAITEEETALMKKHNLRYTYCGRVSDEELNKLYNEAFCFIYPSLYEGFGLPVLEAQMAGCPVLAVNTSSLPEVIGDKNLLLDEITYEALHDKVSLLKDPQTREKIIADGLKNATRFSWDKMTEEYMALYQEAIDNFLKS